MFALPAGRFFSPLDLDLDLRSESYSPAILQKLEWVGGNLESFQKGTQAMERLVGVKISAKGLSNLAEKLGWERAEKRDAEVKRFKAGKLRPTFPEPPPVAVVMLDGGRAQVRAAGSAPGVHEQCWIETKVANLLTYTNCSFKADPQPEPPAAYLDPPRVARIVEEMKGAASVSAMEEVKGPPARRRSESSSKEIPSPKAKVRTVVATTKKAAEFGEMAAADAATRGFYEAGKKAVLGDGSLWIWALAELHFVGFVAILDFLHLLVHLYAAAKAACGGVGQKAWKLYEKMLRLAWAGKATELKGLLAKVSKEAGRAPDGAPEDDPRKVLSRAVDHIEKNRERMDYARYRREGLPISSAPVESLIKQVNRRVKGSEKFWVPEGLEAILQVRSAYLSDDGRAERHWEHRPAGRAVGKNRLKAA